MTTCTNTGPRPMADSASLVIQWVCQLAFIQQKIHNHSRRQNFLLKTAFAEAIKKEQIFPIHGGHVQGV